MNWIFDLAKPGRCAVVGSADLPSKLKEFGTDISCSVDLPNCSLCADFLYSPVKKGIVGISVSVHKDDVAPVVDLFSSASKSLVHVIGPEEKLERYKAYGQGCYIEMKWHASEPVELRQAQSNGVLWFLSAPKKRTSKIAVLVLEDIDYLAAEAQSRLIPP